MSEKEDAIRLANKVLDDHTRDPDDDLSMMSRQFLRALEATPDALPASKGELSDFSDDTIVASISGTTVTFGDFRAARAASQDEGEER